MLGLLAGGLLVGVSRAHTPYQQWVVYRKKHLLIATDKSVEESYPLGRQLAAILAEQLPHSQARVARAPNSIRIASLLATGQFDVALLPSLQAVALMRGDPPFGDYGPLELRALFAVDDFLLICRQNFPVEHAYLVTSTLMQHTEANFHEIGELEIPLHPGSREFLQGD